VASDGALVEQLATDARSEAVLLRCFQDAAREVCGPGTDPHPAYDR